METYFLLSVRKIQNFKSTEIYHTHNNIITFIPRLLSCILLFKRKNYYTLISHTTQEDDEGVYMKKNALTGHTHTHSTQ